MQFVSIKWEFELLMPESLTIPKPIYFGSESDKNRRLPMQVISRGFTQKFFRVGTKGTIF